MNKRPLACLLSALVVLLTVQTLNAGHTGFGPQRGRLLVASDSMGDPRFAESVVLITRHDPSGTAGLLLNRRSSLLPHQLPKTIAQNMRHIYFGGPVAPYSVSALVFAEQPPQGGSRIIEGVYLLGLADLVQLLNTSKGVLFRVFLGYAGWAPGQLERELSQGAWQLHPADAQEMAEDQIERMWQRLQQRGPVISL